MDDYKRLFYMNRPDLISAEIGNVTKRTEFKEKLGCKSFKWYLDNIFPQKFILDDPDHVFSYGRVKNPSSNMCFDTLQKEEKDAYSLGMYPCHKFVAASQFFSFSKKYELRREDSCAEVDALAGSGSESVKMVPCHGQGTNQEWVHTKQGRIIHKATNKCLDSKGGTGEAVSASPCRAVPSQVWFFDNYT
jgi:polypeptide N-acetylgalactosaminyltransferase